MIVIRSRQEGFRRCGVAFAKTAASYPDDAFSESQLAILQAEPMLTVEKISDLSDKSDRSEGLKRKGK